jgi:hypothetical protein
MARALVTSDEMKMDLNNIVEGGLGAKEGYYEVW